MTDPTLYDTGLPDSGLLTLDDITDALLGIIAATIGIILWRRRRWSA